MKSQVAEEGIDPKIISEIRKTYVMQNWDDPRTHPIVIPQNISMTIISFKAKNTFLIDVFTS